MELFRNTVEPNTWDLLQGLMDMPELKEFALVGGTNLSLKLGHRISYDIDLFTNEEFDVKRVFQAILKKHPKTLKSGERGQTLWLDIDKVKVDLILHRYPYLREIETRKNIRFLSFEDIIPMKLEAMATRGKKKDFWDLAALLKKYSFEQMLSFYKEKYSHNEVGHVILSMTYFADAEKEKFDPRDLGGFTWDEIKKKMRETVLAFTKKNIGPQH